MQVSNLYDNGPISPIVKIKENISILTSGKWSHFLVEFIEPMPRSAALVVDFVAAAAAVTIAANAIIQRQIANVLRLSEGEFLHLRWYPIDDVEGLLWQQTSQARYSARSVHSRVDINTDAWDPYLATTTFFVIGMDRDANFEVRNPWGVAQPQARFGFFGYRYVIEALQSPPDRTTYVPAEGYVS